jgi:hypothetical protein
LALGALPDLIPQGAPLVASSRAPSGDTLQPLKLGLLSRDEAVHMYFLYTERLGVRPWTQADLDLAIGLWGDAEVTKLIPPTRLNHPSYLLPAEEFVKRSSDLSRRR